MRILIIDPDYPNQHNFYGDQFVHDRAIAYQKEHDVQVAFVKSNLRQSVDYNHEGIQVKVIDKTELLSFTSAFQPDIVIIHVCFRWLISNYIPNVSVPILVWIHGAEALGWYRRLFNFQFSISFARYIAGNMLQLIKLKKLIEVSNKSKSIGFVFVSEWMRKITETDTISRVLNASVIPNPINTELFKYQPKNVALRKRILLIRSFNSRKYANDLAIKAILLLSTESFFEQITFTIYGEGVLFDELTEPLRHFPNIHLHKTFIRHDDIPTVHSAHGIFLCPTRQDAQGVSMCEAMSSGLVPVTSNNTAIPEFVRDGESGFLTTTPEQIASRISELYHDAQLFLKLSSTAANSIREISGKQIVITKELELINKMVSENSSGRKRG